MIDRTHDPAMSTAIGLVLWGKNIRGSGARGGIGGLIGKFRGIEKVTDGLKKMFQSLRP